MDLCEGGTLRDTIERSTRTHSEDQCRLLLQQLVMGLTAIRTKGISHVRINPRSTYTSYNANVRDANLPWGVNATTSCFVDGYVSNFNLPLAKLLTFIYATQIGVYHIRIRLFMGCV